MPILTMENEDIELDVEGVDDDGPSSLGLGIDPNELPSVSSHLSPELSQHPWLTFDEQLSSHLPTVILHDDMDESSRATIHQMIKEEHTYLQTKKFMRRKKKGLKTLFIQKTPKQLSSYKTRWTKEEKDLFKKGLDEYGHSWKEIADLIKTRTRFQVKSFARNYLQNQASKDGPDFSSISSVQVTERLEGDVDTDQHHSIDEDGGVSMGNQHHHHHLSLNEEEEDVDIDVEETSDSEHTGQGLQSTLLFGDILRQSLPTHHTNPDSQQEEENILSGNTEQGGESLDKKSTTTLIKKRVKLEDPQPPCHDRIVKAEAGTDGMDVIIASYVEDVTDSSSPVNIKTENISSEVDKGPAKGLLEQVTTSAINESRLREKRRDRKGGRKRTKEISDKECSKDGCNVALASDSVETTQESSLPGNIRSRREHKRKLNERNIHVDRIRGNTRKGKSKPFIVKAEEKIQNERKLEQVDHHSGEFLEVEIKIEQDDCDYEENVTSEIQTVFVRNKDFTTLCKGNLGTKSVVERMFESEPDIMSTTATQQATSKDSKKQHDCNCSSVGHNLTDNEENENLKSSYPHIRSTSCNSLGLPPCTTKHRQNRNDCQEEKYIDPERSKEHDGDIKTARGGERSNCSEETNKRDGTDSSFEHTKDQSYEESDEETIELPKEEVTLDPHQVTYGEKVAHPTFFDFNSSSKTPGRYLTIRNHIIKCWLKIKPTYLNKTVARTGLKRGGDVNSIGLIHEYLESIGAINFGAHNPNQQKERKRRKTVEHWAHMNKPESKTDRLESMRPRRKIFPKHPGDKCIEEKTNSVSEQRTKPKSRQQKAPSYDPFKLIDCYKFSSTLLAPFSVKVKGDVIVTMDLHSHLSTTEVIGLLGGHFDEDHCILDVRLARPCRSLSTGMQCEMDPVSQTEACEDIHSAGCRVVGWYHSHPTFSPNPSIRDIETQGHFQEWFNQDTKTPFIGIIVSPYHSRQLVTSKINCLTVSQEWSPDCQCWRPYKFDFSVYQDKNEASSHQQLLSTASLLVAEFAQYKYRVEMLWVCPGQSGITYLEKMLESINTNLCGSEEAKTQTLSKLKDMVYDLFSNQCSTVIKDSALDSAGVQKIAPVPGSIGQAPVDRPNRLRPNQDSSNHEIVGNHKAEPYHKNIFTTR